MTSSCARRRRVASWIGSSDTIFQDSFGRKCATAFPLGAYSRPHFASSLSASARYARLYPCRSGLLPPTYKRRKKNRLLSFVRKNRKPKKKRDEFSQRPRAGNGA